MNGDGFAESGGGTQLPPHEQLRRGLISWEQYQEKIKVQETEAAELSRRVNQPQMEHVSPEQAEREARARAKNHPTHGNPGELPVRWTSAGQVIKPEER